MPSVYRPLIVMGLIQLTSSWNISIQQDELCNNKDDSIVSLEFTPDEFIDSFRKVFVMSDGSTAGFDSIPSSSELVSYTNSIMQNVGIGSRNSPARFHVCESNLMNVYMLAAVGNFAAKRDSNTNTPFPHIVVDAYTGKIAVATSYADVRTMFLETLLVICIITIARIYMFQMKQVYA